MGQGPVNLPDGIVAVVKRDCPTCSLVVPVMQQLSADPDIDLERNYVEKTLTSTGLVSEVEHYLPDNPLKTAKTATGGEFHSDGRPGDISIEILTAMNPFKKSRTNTG